MDPYKVLGISASQVKHDSDLDKVRHRAKTLFKRLGKEGKKFEAKKILEAFDLVKQRLKSRVGEGQYKILGRSRKERELDRHFNHQTKEIKNDKRLKKALKAARHGTLKERLHLPGDKERIPRHRRRRHRDRRRRREQKRKATDVNILEGLRRLAVFLPQEKKFPKVVKLLHRWMKDYMNQDTREYAFQVLDNVAQCAFLTNDPDSRQDVIQVFEYVLAYFKDWFEKGDDTNLLAQQWHVATVLASQCFTDDAFVMTSVIIKLNKAMELLEKHRDLIGVVPVKRERIKKEEDVKRAKLEKDDESEVKSEMKSEDEDEGAGPCKVECKDECKEEPEESEKPKTESTNGQVKAEEKGAKRPLMAKPLVGMGMAQPVVAGPALPVGPAGPPGPPGPAGSSPEAGEDGGDLEILSSGSDGDVCELSDGDDDVLDIGSVGSDDELDEIEIGDDDGDDGSDGVDCCEESSGEVEEIEGSIWPTPHIGRSLELLRSHFVDRCMATLFQQRSSMWARGKVDAFFQDMFYRRSVFSPEQQLQLEAWQSRIKTMQREGERAVGEANNPLEAQRPVVDSREMKTVFGADSNTWAAKQTFDSRESSAQRVIR